MRESAKLTGLVALLAVGVNCSSNKGGGGEGTVNIAVVNAASEGIVTVNYLIHAGTPVPAGPAIPDVVGVINVSDPSATPSVDHSFPASTGDVVTMTAVTTGPSPVTCTGTSAPFTVTAGGVASVSVTITCPNGANNMPNQNNGDVIVSGNFVSTGDNCPLLTSWVASPLQTSGPGGVVNVGASATDADGDTLAYTWTATGGSFGESFPATSPATTYSCPAIASGTSAVETLSLSVSDNKGCTATLPNAIHITCVGVAVTTTGAAGGPGTGVGGAGGGGPSLDSCTACEVARCSNPVGLKSPSDNYARLVGAYGVCFAGTGWPAAQADPSVSCGVLAGEQGATATNGPAAGTPKTTLCQALLQCLHASSCDGAPDYVENDCYCGANVDLNTCLDPAFTPTGACQAQILAALETDSFSSASVGNFNDRCLANGAAFEIYTICDADCCPEECLGLTPTQSYADPTFCNAVSGTGGATGSGTGGAAGASGL
jgi:hypothetical protein